MILKTNLNVKTKYKTVVPRGARGIVMTWVVEDYTHIVIVKVEFVNGECLWFLERDLEEVEG